MILLDSEDRIVEGMDAARRRFRLQSQSTGERPVFVLAAGWRSGSTLMQRLLASDSLLLWGEPFSHSAIIRAAAEAWAPFSAQWPDARHVLSNFGATPHGDNWIANFYPDPHDLLAAQQQYLQRLFAVPAEKAGYPRWGLKGVRLGGGAAVFLQWLFPDARFVYLVRNPFDAYLSYRTQLASRQNPHGWYHRWPDKQVRTAHDFATIWRTLTESMRRYEERTQGAFVRYEDLSDSATIQRVATVTDIPVQSDQIGEVVGSSYRAGTNRGQLSTTEERTIRAVTGVIAEELHYFAPTTG